MSEKEKKHVKKKSRKLLSLPSFRKSKKLNQIKEDVCLESEPDFGDSLKPKHGSDGSLPSIGLVATVSLDSPKKGNLNTDGALSSLGQCHGSSTPNSDRRSFSNLRSAYLENPDFARGAVSPRVRRLELGGFNNLSTDSGIDCSVLLSEKGSPERFQEFTRRESERIRREHLHSLNESLRSETTDVAASLENGLPDRKHNDNEGNEEADNRLGTQNSSLQEQIEQTKEHISLLSELRTVLEQKLEACNDSSVTVHNSHIPSDNDIDEIINPVNDSETIDNLNPVRINSNEMMAVNTNNGDSTRTRNSEENYNLYLHTNRTDERKSEEARLRREHSASSFTNSLLIDSPHLIVSPTAVVSPASTASHRVLPSTPSPVRLYVNEKSAFAKCKSLRRSVSDVGKGLLGKFRQKKKDDLQSKGESNRTRSITSESMRSTEIDSEVNREINSCSNNLLQNSFSAHFETSLLCEDNETFSIDSAQTDPTGITQLNTGTGILGIDFSNFQSLEPNCTSDSSIDDNHRFRNSIHSEDSINAIQELTTSICEMTSKLTCSSSADSIACICDCKNRSSSPPCCDKSKTPSPISMESSVNINKDIDDRSINLHINNIKETLEASRINNGSIEKIENREMNEEIEIESVQNIGENADENEPLTLSVASFSESVNEVINSDEPVVNSLMKINQEEADFELNTEETDSLLPIKASINPPNNDINIKPKMIKPYINQNIKSDKVGLSNKFMSEKTCDESINKSWFCDTEDDSSDDESSESTCSGCSDEDCSSRKLNERRKLITGTDSSSGDTSPVDCHASDLSSESDSETSSLECTPEKNPWKDAMCYKDYLDKSPCSVSFRELDFNELEPCNNERISKYEREFYFPINSPQSNFPSPAMRFSPACTSKTPASSPVTFKEPVTYSPLNKMYPTSNQRQELPDGCRRKDSYRDLPVENVLLQTYNNTVKLEAGNNMQQSETAMETLESRQEKQPDIINTLVTSPETAPLDLSFKRGENRGSSRTKPNLWMDRHVGQVFSPAKRVLHKNQDLSETDLCRTILDLYVSDAEESGFEPEFENSFNSSLNYSGTSRNTSLNCSNSSNTSGLFNNSLNSSSFLEPSCDPEDSMLQYGTYVAPRRPRKETNVDSFSTTVVSSCYTAQAKTRKLQGGKYIQGLHRLEMYWIMKDFLNMSLKINLPLKVPEN